MILTFLKENITLATDRFLSSSWRLQNVDLLRRSKLVISFSISYTACGLIFVPFYFLLGCPQGAFAILLSNLLIFLTVYLIKFTGSPILAGNWVVANVYLLLFFLTFISGGYSGPILAWLVSLPVLATILAKKDSGKIWVGFVILQVMFFYCLEVSGYHFPVIFEEHSLHLIRALSFISLAVLIWLFASLYEIFHAEAMKVISSLSVTDELTGLYNWQGFQTLSKQQMRLAERGAKTLALISMEIHRLSDLREHLGREACDRAVSAAAHIIHSTLRESDILARVGENEFAFTAIPSHEGDVDIILGRLILNFKHFNDQKKFPFEILMHFGSSLHNSKRESKRPTIEEMLEVARQNRLGEKK